MSRTVNPTPQFFDSSGDPLVNGKMYFYMSGTTTDLVTYADVNQTIANTQPVVLTADGRLPNAFYSGQARIVLTDKDDVQIWERDPVGEGALSGSIANWSSLVNYDLNDIVRGSDDALYQSIQSGNTNNDPVSNPDWWAEIRFVNVWNQNVTYMQDDIVQRGGFFYRSKTNSNTGNDPIGDTTNWGGTQSTDIADGSITLVKMEDMNQNEIIGRITAGSGSPEHLTAAQTRTVLNVEDGATANQTDAFLLDRANHTGTQIMSTISDAGALATLDSVSGTEIDALAVDTGELADDAVTLDKMAAGAAGNLISYDASGDPVAVATGTADQILTSNGPGLPPEMKTLVVGDAIHDLTSSSDVTMIVAAGGTISDYTTAGQVIATKASVPLKTTDRFELFINDLVLDGSAISITTTVAVWIRINSNNSIQGRLDNGTAALSLNGNGRISLASLQAGTTDTYYAVTNLEILQFLASDFIGSDGDYTVDVMACSTQGDDTPIVKGTTTTTTFEFRVSS